MDKNTLSARSNLILGAIIQEYIRTVEPVGSKAVSGNCCVGLSPASIRKTMSELEEEGFLSQPHTSAGRVPTEKSFRYYVDSLLELREPPEWHKNLIRGICESPHDVSHIIREASRALSTLTRCAGLVLVPGTEHFTIKHLKLVCVDETTLMLVVATGQGMVHTGLIRMKREELKRLNLERVANYLNHKGKGLTLEALRRKIVEEMRMEKNLYDELMANALRLSEVAFLVGIGSSSECIYVDGTTNIMDQPEFREDFEKMKTIFNAFEEKGLLVKVLDKSTEHSGIHVHLGSESDVKEFEGLSFVTAPYGSVGNRVGTLGVIGPVRMDYSRIVPIVGYAALSLDNLLARGQRLS